MSHEISYHRPPPALTWNHKRPLLLLPPITATSLAMGRWECAVDLWDIRCLEAMEVKVYGKTKHMEEGAPISRQQFCERGGECHTDRKPVCGCLEPCSSLWHLQARIRATGSQSTSGLIQGEVWAFPRRFVSHESLTGDSGLLLLWLFSHSVVSDSLWPQALWHSRLLCPSLSSRVCPDLCPLSWWCCPTISSSATPFSSCPQSFPASGSFTMRRLFELCGQHIGASTSASALPIFKVDFL